MKKNNIKTRNYAFTYPKIVALGFAFIILTGTLLLMLPISSKGDVPSFLDALFTATSATCVTGLIVADTFSRWTLFGQLVILVMIQLGGLGFITILATVSRFLRKKITLKEKMLLKESIGSMYLGSVSRLGKKVLLGTAIIEGTGALIMCFRFIPQMGFKNGLYTSVFMSVSAFCNAGFDVMGRVSPGSSITTVNSDPVIMLTLSLLIIVGGIGFIVWDDIVANKFRFKKYMLHTKLVLITTGVLLFGGVALFALFEYDNAFKEMGFVQGALNAIMSSVTPRTAGFNSIDVGSMTNLSKTLTMVLMFIGGSSGSTAGGVKTTTIAVLILCVMSTLKNRNGVNSFNRRIEFDSVRKAISIVFINSVQIIIATIIICTFQNGFKEIDVLFECFSAIGTVGMTTGITPLLGTVPKIIIIYLMFVGRLTSLTFALMFLNGRAKVTSQMPKGKIVIG